MARRWAPLTNVPLAEARLKLEESVLARMEVALKDCKTPLAKAMCREAYGKMLHSLEDVLRQQHGYPPTPTPVRHP